MRSSLAFDSIDNGWIPKKEKNDKDECLLYIHIPFCESLCPYCSFHRYVFEEELALKYFMALNKEIEMYGDLDYNFTGMYIGGGTPTIAMDQLLKTINLTKKLFSLKEISVETNPNHITDERLQMLKSAGINRLSVGVQSFDDMILKNVGRYDRYGSGAEIQQRLKKVIGQFDTLNIDLIFNIPSQTEKSLERDLEIIARLLPDQVTFYPLMSSAAVENVLEKTLGIVDYLKEQQMYAFILENMKRNYQGSTAWCFSRGCSMIDEYVVVYDKYIGVGSGAFGYCNGQIYANTFSLHEYIKKANDGMFPITSVKKFTKRENMYYFLLMKLFSLSMSKRAFEEKFSESIEKVLWKEMLILRLLHAIKDSGDTVELTDRGRYLWVMGMREFFIAVDNLRDHCRKNLHYHCSNEKVYNEQVLG